MNLNTWQEAITWGFPKCTALGASVFLLEPLETPVARYIDIFAPMGQGGF